MKLKLFYSYCQKNDTERAELEKHLNTLVSNNSIDEWYDGKIVAGENSWAPEKAFVGALRLYNVQVWGIFLQTGIKNMLYSEIVVNHLVAGNFFGIQKLHWCDCVDHNEIVLHKFGGLIKIGT